jgi:hypothetical protein
MRWTWTLLVLVACTPPPAPVTTVVRPPPTTPCAEACAYIEACLSGEPPYCPDDCETIMAPRGVAEQYRDCVRALSCEDIRRSTMMDQGPLGDCYVGVAR